MSYRLHTGEDGYLPTFFMWIPVYVILAVLVAHSPIVAWIAYGLNHSQIPLLLSMEWSTFMQWWSSLYPPSY